MTVRWRSPRSKYRNVKVTVDGFTFDSKKEAHRYRELRLLEKAGEITRLCRQPQFLLHAHPAGQFIGVYVADFQYVQVKTGAIVREDVKGVRTALYNWKKKHVEAEYGITVVEI